MKGDNETQLTKMWIIVEVGSEICGGVSILSIFGYVRKLP